MKALRRRYGHAGVRPIRLASDERVGVGYVLAGAYRGKDTSKRKLLEHAVVVKDGIVKRTLCRRIDEGHLSDLVDEDLSAITCPECRRRLPAVVRP